MCDVLIQAINLDTDKHLMATESVVYSTQKNDKSAYTNNFKLTICIKLKRQKVTGLKLAH